jgi:hypothetical protein
VKISLRWRIREPAPQLSPALPVGRVSMFDLKRFEMRTQFNPPFAMRFVVLEVRRSALRAARRRRFSCA